MTQSVALIAAVGQNLGTDNAALRIDGIMALMDMPVLAQIFTVVTAGGTDVL